MSWVPVHRTDTGSTGAPGGSFRVGFARPEVAHLTEVEIHHQELRVLVYRSGLNVPS